MGISLLTALQIQGNPVLAGVRKHENGKFVSIILHDEDKRFRLLLSSAPDYETSEEAEQAGLDLIDEINGTDLSERIGKLNAILPQEEQEVISKIVHASGSSP